MIFAVRPPENEKKSTIPAVMQNAIKADEEVIVRLMIDATNREIAKTSKSLINHGVTFAHSRTT
jgi:hypothetical protein